MHVHALFFTRLLDFTVSALMLLNSLFLYDCIETKKVDKMKKETLGYY